MNNFEMSMISEQVKEIKACAYAHDASGDAIYGTAGILYQAADTIETLYAKLTEYMKIGTVEECQEARERQRARKIVIKNTKNKNLERGIYVFYKCPKCEEQIASGFYYPPHNEFLQEHKFCENCGQAIDWSE